MIGGPLSGFLAMMSGFLVIAGLVSAFTHAPPRMVPDRVELDGSCALP